MHFFVNPDNLIPQTDDQAYGPVKQQEQTKYRVTSKFKVSTETAAIAALDGIILVQPSDSGTDLCNLVIRVNDLADSRTQFDRIDYIIYRGIQRSSFLTIANIPTLLPADADNSELIASIWAAYAQAKVDPWIMRQPDFFTEPTADWLGFNRTDATQTLDAAFADKTKLSPLAVVTAGMSLGMFASGVDAGIEFVIFDRFYKPTIGDLRAAEMIFEVSSPAGSIAGHDGDYAVQRKRENILNYIDPAAYYTMHFRTGVKYKDASGAERICADVEAISNTLLNAFEPSKNRLYIDIRNELGGSLNFYRDNEGSSGFQDRHFRYGFNESDLASSNYYTDHWPIYSIVISPEQITPDNRRLLLQVRKVHNPKPLLFLDYGYSEQIDSKTALTSAQRFTDVTEGSGSTAEWSAYLSLKLLPPAKESYHPIWFIKLMCIRQEVPADLATTAPSAPPRHYALDNVFGPIRADMLTGKKENVMLPGKKYMANVGGKGGSIVHICKILGQEDVTFKAEPLFNYDKYAFSAVSFNSLIPPVFFDDARETKWLLQPDIIVKQVNIQTDGKNIAMLQEDLSLTASLSTPNLSITLLNQQVRSSLLPSLSAFDPLLDDTYLAFTTVTREQDDDSRKITVEDDGFFEISVERIKYISAHIELVGLLQNEFFGNNPPLSAIVCYTLDSQTFVSEGSAIGLNFRLLSNPDAYIPVNKIISYVKTVESISFYTQFDTDAIKTATRLRQHYYGLWGHGQPEAYFKGIIFNEAINRATYRNYIQIFPNSYSFPVKLDSEVMGKTIDSREAYVNLLTQADENGLSGNPSPYIVLRNRNENTIEYIDLGHALYGFEAWALGPNGTSSGYQSLKYPISESPDLAGLIGDLAPAVSGFIYRLTHNEAYRDNPYYPIDNDLAKFYQISNPDADLLSDADGLGLSNTYSNLLNDSKPFPTLSQVLTVYYANVPFTSTDLPNLKNHYLASHYSRRWLTLASEFGLIKPENELVDKYEQTTFYWIENNYANFNEAYDKLFEKTVAVSNLLYTQEFYGLGGKLWSFFSVVSRLPVVDIMETDLRHSNYTSTASVINSVIKDFLLPSLRRKIKSEQPNMILK